VLLLFSKIPRTEDSIPDDDDEVIEIVDEARTDSPSTGSYVLDEAGISSDSDHHQSAKNSTPMTSPLKKDVSSYFDSRWI
jgi:hypothetical protein